MHVLPVIRIRSLLVATIVLASSATAARAHVNLLAPNGGEVLEVGSVFTISWRIQIAHNLQNWDLWYSTAGTTGPWTTIAMNLPAGSGLVGSIHTYHWTVPDVVDETVWVRVRMDNSATDYSDVSYSPFSIVPPPPCPADLDGDGEVRVPDLIILLAAWGPVPTPGPPDFDGDGEVRVPDLISLLAAWGACT